MFNYNPGAEEPAATVKTSQGDYRVMVSRGAIEAIGPEMRQAGVNGRGVPHRRLRDVPAARPTRT